MQFIFTFTGRWIILNIVKQQLLSGKVYFNILMVGSSDNAIRIYKETEKSLHTDGYRYAGFVTPDIKAETEFLNLFPYWVHWISWRKSLIKIISARWFWVWKNRSNLY